MATPTFHEIGTQFVTHYYTTFDSNRQGLLNLYGEQSMLTFEEKQVQGAQNIVNQLTQLQFKQVRHQIVKCDCQPSTNSGVLVFVTGNMFVDGETNPLKFAQVFHLVQNANGQGYYCHNDLFRLNIG
eukprot:GDKH01001233.1.p1 GENE.GDKH01001233.1~~GDKH01001233.1.p1  ORF type:complete len:127 (+),score=32.12 GDKH01001233.1:140-520(+)